MLSMLQPDSPSLTRLWRFPRIQAKIARLQGHRNLEGGRHFRDEGKAMRQVASVVTTLLALSLQPALGEVEALTGRVSVIARFA